MKKLDLSHVEAGVRRLGGSKFTLLHLQESFTEVTGDIIKGLIENASGYTVLYGCVNSGAGLTYNISAGAIYYNGEVYEVPAFSGTSTGANVPVLNFVTSYIASDPALYSDSNTYNTHSIVTGIWVFGLTGTGQVDFSGLSKMRLVLGGLLASESGYSLKHQSAWVNIPLINGWTAGTDAPINPTPQYRISDQGIVYLRGRVMMNGATSGNFTTGLPQPDYDGATMICDYYNGSSRVYGLISGSDSGSNWAASFGAYVAGGGRFIQLSGISYHLRSVWPQP